MNFVYKKGMGTVRNNFGMAAAMIIIIALKVAQESAHVHVMSNK